ncbi:MAG: class I SAM-dependent RNA methyltransferase [Nitrospirae bacterium]|nr:class I SAM-dependent RNA methyltransferase [Nitrospirota bacterium]
MVIKALSPVYGGYVISRADGIIFIRGALPEEIVEISITEKKKDYSVATVKNVIEPSPHRIEPLCPVFGTCGGCHFQFISYEKQVSMKEEVLIASLQRIGNIETPLECPLMIDKINILLKRIREKNLSGLKEMHISYGGTATALIKPEALRDDIELSLIDMGFSGVSFENGESVGRDYITLDLNGLSYTITPWTFFQAHWDLNRKVVELVVNSLYPLEGMHVLDLYAGAGNFSLSVARHAAQVVAVEENPYAVEDGQRNAKLNNIENCKFVKTSAEKYKAHEKVDILLLDPPRPGLTDEVSKKILKFLPQRIVYVSCNPSTFARDLKKLKDNYNIDSIRMIDFFPNTYHVEALAFLSLK